MDISSLLMSKKGATLEVVNWGGERTHREDLNQYDVMEVEISSPNDGIDRWGKPHL